MVNLKIKEISSKFNVFLDCFLKHYEYDDFTKDEFFEEKLIVDLDEWIKDEDENEEELEDTKYFLKNIQFCFLEADEEILAKVIKKYFLRSFDLFYYYQYDYHRFGAHLDYLYELNPVWLYLCGLYFDSIEDGESAVYSYYFCLLTLCKVFNLSSIDFDNSCYEVIDLLESKFDGIIQMLYADWLVINPNLARAIGYYYLHKKNYEKAFVFFKRGASMNYDGRQSIEPFIAVDKNTYELALLYLNGLGVEKDIDYAIHLFKKIADENGKDYLPILGDLYYEGIGVDQDFEMALKCYTEPYECEYIIYFLELNEVQIERLDKILQDKLKDPNISNEDLKYIVNVYKMIINDWEKADEVEQLIKENS